MPNSALATAQQAILSRFDTQWASDTPVAWPNAPFNPPSPPKIWVQVDVLWAETVATSMGATDRNTNSGLVQVTIYGPRGKGMGAIMAKADAARNVYDRAEFSGVRCASADAPRPTPHDEWAVRIVRVPFTVDETT